MKPSKVNIAGISCSVTQAIDGDIAVVPDGDGFIVGIFNGDQTHVIFGDVEREIGHLSAFTVEVGEMLPSAGQFIGRKFDTYEEARDALAVHRRPASASQPTGGRG